MTYIRETDFHDDLAKTPELEDRYGPINQPELVKKEIKSHVISSKILYNQDKPNQTKGVTTMKASKLYYCKAGGHYFYYQNDDTDTEPLFFMNAGEKLSPEEKEVYGEMIDNAEEKYCGCTDH